MTGYAIGTEPQAAESEPRAAERTRLSRARRTMLSLTGATLLGGLIVTAVLTVLAHTVYVHNEHRLLRLRARDAGALVSTALTGVQTPLASAAELADATGGSPARFRAFAKAYAGPGRAFTSVSMWDLHDLSRGPVAVVGTPPELSGQTSRLSPFFARVRHATTLSVIGLLSGPQPRLGYGYSVPGAGRYAAYAESALPRSRYSPVGKSSPFAGMRYVLYLDRAQPSELLATNVHDLPLTGGVTERVPFGDSTFVLKLAQNGPLSGTLPRALPWIILIGGILLSLAAAGGVLRLSERRLRAEGLAGELEEVATENRRLYSEQRTIAQTLQQALLPDQLPQLDGIQAAGQYEAGERSMDIGGDWYDVVALEDGNLLLVVGDVSGRGLRAATTMASLRFAIHAYALEDPSPDGILRKLSGLITLTRERQLATTLCAHVDVPGRRATVASAGHLPPLLMWPGGTEFPDVPTGLPIGVEPDVEYRSVTLDIPPQATLLAFTDGLVERRGEKLDDGLDRLRQAARQERLALPQLLSKLVADLSAGQAKDDIAIVGLRWTN